MHERSLVRALLTQVDQIRRRNNAGRVTEVRVAVGPLSNVEPLLFGIAFEELADGGAAAGAELVIDDVSLTAACLACDHHFEVVAFDFCCPRCAGSVKVTGGDTLQLVSVSLDECDPVRETMS